MRPDQRAIDERRAAVIAAMDDAFDKATVDSGYWDWRTVLGRMADAAITACDATPIPLTVPSYSEDAGQ
jgi:hypothetical protein